MRYTIIVPVCNGEKTLPRCVAALLEQSCRDVEILLVEHGSADGSAMLCHGYQAAYPDQIRVLQPDVEGIGQARNAGINGARGDYLLFAECTAPLLPDALARLAERIDREPADLYLTGTEPAACITLGERPELLLAEQDVRDLVWKRQLFDDAYLRFPEETGYDDLRMTRKALALSRRIATVPERIRTVGEDVPVEPERELAVLDALDDIRGYYQRRGLLEHYGGYLARLAGDVICRRARQVLAEGQNPGSLVECVRYLDARFPDRTHIPGQMAKLLELIRQEKWKRLKMLFFLKRKH